jgi:recombinational DNA repair protein RecT
MQRDEIEKIKRASKAGDSQYSPWTIWPTEMWKKSAVKRIAKLLPLSVESEKAISTDETVKTEIAPDMTEVADEIIWNNADDAQSEIKEAPLPINKLTTKQDNAIKELAKRVYKSNYAEELLNRIGAEFGVSTLSELTEEMAAELIRRLSQEAQDA